MSQSCTPSLLRIENAYVEILPRLTLLQETCDTLRCRNNHQIIILPCTKTERRIEEATIPQFEESVSVVRSDRLLASKQVDHQACMV